MRKEYSTVKIPIELAFKLDELEKDLGYHSRAEIVDDAIRRFIEAITWEVHDRGSKHEEEMEKKPVVLAPA